MSKKQIIIFLILGILVIFSIPFFLSENFNNNLNIGISLVSGVASIITLVIALLLFNQFGIDSSLLEKQTDEVFKLLNDLNKTSVYLEGNQEWMRFNPAKPYRDFYEQFYDRRLIFSENYMKGLQDIWKHSDNIFLPKEIAQQLQNLQIYSLSDLTKKINTNELKVTARGENKIDEKVGIGNQKEVLMIDFVRDWANLIDVIKTWIQNNSSINSNLNL